MVVRENKRFHQITVIGARVVGSSIAFHLASRGALVYSQTRVTDLQLAQTKTGTKLVEAVCLARF